VVLLLQMGQTAPSTQLPQLEVDVVGMTEQALALGVLAAVVVVGSTQLNELDPLALLGKEALEVMAGMIR
jgi:hypothetical protein